MRSLLRVLLELNAGLTLNEAKSTAQQYLSQIASSEDFVTSEALVTTVGFLYSLEHRFIETWGNHPWLLQTFIWVLILD